MLILFYGFFITKRKLFNTRKIQKIMKPQFIKNPKIPPTFLPSFEASKENRRSSNLSTSQQIYLTPEKPSPPTDYCRIKHQKRALICSQSIFLNSRILEFCDIAPLVRERMVTWIMQQCFKRCLQRQTYALTISLLDLFLMRRGQVTTQKIQQLGIACLNLACKYNQSFTRPIQSNPQLFSQESISKFQLEILKKMNFKLNAPNYATIAHFLITHWDFEADKYISLKNMKFYQDKIKSYLGQTERKILSKIGRFYQLIDCCIGVKEMLDYDLEDLVYNCFVVFVRGQQFFGAVISEKFENDIKKALCQIFEASSELKKDPILLDISLQKLIEIPYEHLKQIHKRTNFSSSLPINNPTFMVPDSFPNLAPKYQYMLQSYQPYCLKIIKQSARQIQNLQSSFQFQEVLAQKQSYLLI